ncbi:2-hydroxychromene-2-carboxylate dehydrogenase [Gammaproteobacteria bacterium LSUCC0112]|nr:2-hydroxychromene-2-carboxylate dehydrogenase [Gammaproteobacteria bacterium LSUCC0112]
MTIKRWVRTRGLAILTSPMVRHLRRSKAALLRRLRRQPAVVHYFHQVDDPYSDLAVRALPHLAANYAIKIVPHLVPAPDAGAAPELQRLMDWSLRDAADLANALGLAPSPWGKAPSADVLAQAQAALAGMTDPILFAEAAAKVRLFFSRIPEHKLTEKELDELGLAATGYAAAALTDGQALRDMLGHYLGGMFFFEDEWYWGLDRLNWLEQRLQPLARHSHVVPFAPRLEASVVSAATPSIQASSDNQGPILDLYFSFRSPYSWIVLPRVIALANKYHARLRLRFVLPMVMRGLPIPDAKRFYIVSDTKREAERVGLPFGMIADPVGKPTERGLAVLHHAIEHNKGEAFAVSFMRGVFAEGINARSDSGLLKLCQRAGINVEQMHAALADTRWRAVAEANREEMFKQGIWGVPAFRVNEGSAHWGQDRLWLLEKQLRQATTPAPDAPH